MPHVTRRPLTTWPVSETRRSIRETLNPLHCISWSDMPPHLPQQVLDLVMEALGGPRLDLDQLRLSARSERERPTPRFRLLGDA